MKKPRAVHYVNNKQMYETMKVYIEAVNEAEKNNKPLPRIPEYIGDCIKLICNKLSLKYQFSGYTQQWKEEMISDGMENCIMAINNFDPNKSNNPFAYFTQIAWNAFIRRIKREKVQVYIKHKNMQNNFILDDIMSEYGAESMSGDQKSDDVIRDFEDKIEANKKKKKNLKKKGVENFL